MTTLVGHGDRLITTSGRESWLKRPSVPLSVFSGGGSVGLSGGGYASYQTLYESQPWAFVDINKINRQIARLPLKTYQLLEGERGQGNGERKRVRNHPLPDLLAGRTEAQRRSTRSPSPLWLKQKAAFPTLLHGNGLMAKGIDGPGQPPSALLPLDWRYMRPICDQAGEVLAWETDQPGRTRFLAPDSVVHFAWEAGIGDLGVSPLKALGVTLRTEDAAQRYQSASFDNGVRYSSVYVLPDGVEMDDKDKEALRQSLKQQAGGVDRGGQMALATGGGDVKTLSHSAVEAELIEQRKLDREEIAAVYDIPPPLIGILDHATYSNVAEMHRMLYGMVLGPWLVLIEETLQAQLIDSYDPWREEGLFVEFDLAEVLKGDTLKEVLAIKEGIAAGIMTPNEGRDVRNQPRSTDPAADRLYMPVNNLAPIGAQQPDVTKGVLARHLERAVERVGVKMAAGAEPWDRERFVRELTDDLDPAQSVVAEAMADVLEELVADVAGDHQAFRRRAADLVA